MKPIKGSVFAERIITENKTASGIIIPDSVKKENKFKVVAVGSGVQFLNVGDTVKMYNGAMRPDIDYNGKLVKVLREKEDIEFVFEKRG